MFSRFVSSMILWGLLLYIGHMFPSGGNEHWILYLWLGMLLVMIINAIPNLTLTVSNSCVTISGAACGMVLVENMVDGITSAPLMLVVVASAIQLLAIAIHKKFYKKG